MKFNLFKKTKVENSADIEGMSVTLPKSGKEMLLTDVLAEMDKIQNMQGYANGDHMVKVGEDEMSVNDLLKKHMDMCNSIAEEKAKKESLDNESEEDKQAREKKENDDKEEAEKLKKENEDKEASEKKENELKKKANVDKLKNAQDKAKIPVARVDLSEDRLARGKERY